MKKKLIISATEPITLATGLKGTPRYLSQFFEVKLVAAPGPEVERVADYEGVPLTCIPMTRRVTPFTDLKALLQLCAFFARERPDIVHSFTPKAGLLSMIAAATARVPHRVHSILGMPLMEARGSTRAILSLTERATYLFATHILCTGPGLRDYVRPRLTQKAVEVIGDGGLGVDMEAFRDNFDEDEKRLIRKELNLAAEDFVVAFAGRMVRDKGIVELVDAVVDAHRRHPHLRLLLIGAYDEARDVLPPRTKELIANHPAIRHQGWTWDVRPSLAVANAFVLPSYREGLSTCLIEACAFGLPCLASDIIGVREIITHGINGILLPPKSSEALARGICDLIEEPEKYCALKANTRASVETKFSRERYRQGLKDEYLSLLAASDLAAVTHTQASRP